MSELIAPTDRLEVDVLWQRLDRQTAAFLRSCLWRPGDSVLVVSTPSGLTLEALHELCGQTVVSVVEYRGSSNRRVMMVTENSSACGQSPAPRVPRSSTVSSPVALLSLARQWSTFALAVAVLLSAACPVAAQKSLPDSAGEASPSSTSGKDASQAQARLTDPPKANEHVIFVDENGEVVRLTAGGQIGDYLKWRQQLLQGTNDKGPGYYVAAVTLTGDVNAARTTAKLDASIEVFVRGGINRVDVPLRLNEATLLAHRQTQAGDIEFLPTERGTGLKCRISGAGQHRIDLQISVPVRKSGKSYRVQLSLPGTAQSSLRLVVPGDAIAVRPDQFADIEVEALPDARSALIAHGLGDALDLPWQLVETQPAEETSFQVETLLSADAGEDGVAIEAVQTIVASGASFDSVRVNVPPGSNVLSVSSATHDSIETSDLQTNPVVISLQESTAGPLKLKWLISSEVNTDMKSFSISGFPVENATREETLIGLRVAEGFRLSQLTPRPQQVQRIATSLFRKRVESQLDPQTGIQQAYRLANRNSRVHFQIDRIEANYRVIPAYELTFREASADLEARYEIIVYRGSLDHIQLRWPGLASQQWEQLEVIEPADLVHIAGQSTEDTDTADDQVGASQIRLEFVEPLNRTHGPVTVKLQARRPVPLGEEPFLISIPVADSESRPVSHVTLFNASNVESTLAGARNTSIRFLSDVTGGAATKRAGRPLNQVPRQLESTSSDLEFRATVMTHGQTVTASSHAILTLSENRINVEQRLHYSVTYEELDRLRIFVPGSVTPEEFRLTGDDGISTVPLTAEVGGLEIEGVRQIRVNLPQPILGQFEVICTYSVPVDAAFVDSGIGKSDVPLLQPADVPGKSTRVELRSPGNVGVLINGVQWAQELTLSNAPTWVASGMLSNVGLTLEAAPERATQNFVVRRSLIRTRFQNGGSVRTTCVSLIDGDISFLTVSLPAETDRSSLTAWWDGKLVTTENLLISSRDDDLIEVRLLLDEQMRREQHSLTFEFDVNRVGTFDSINDLFATAPGFADDVWLADTLWEVILPADQHLLVYPDNYTPAFSWQRQGFAWTRRPIGGSVSLIEWLLADADLELATELPNQLKDLRFDPLAGTAYGNSYLFSSFGHHQKIRIQSMSQPAVILAGAGLALAFGLALLRIPATRHVLTILVVGFGLSLAGLWHLEAVQLLLQPAVFGVVLAFVALVVESRVKRRQRASLVTFSSPSDFLVPGSSREEIIYDESGERSERPA
jgi:hypothetical protein